MTEKALTRRNPTRGLGTAMSPFFRGLTPFDPFFRTMDRFLDEPWNRWLEESTVQGWVPAVNISEKDEVYLVSAELPGLNKKDVEITVEDNRLTISGERKWDEETREENYHRIERAYGKFSRTFMLNTPVMADKVKATFKDGVLDVSIPKTEEAKPRKIAIN